MPKTSAMIIDPIDLADRLAELLKAKNQNETYVVRKQHRKTVVEAEILLRSLFGAPIYAKKKPLSNEEVMKLIAEKLHYSEYKKGFELVREIEERHSIKWHTY